MAIYNRADSGGAVLFILNRLRPDNFACPVWDIESVQLEGDLLMLLLKDSRGSKLTLAGILTLSIYF